ncbi:MAG TPA: hypothetical protein VG405_11345 [Solirubrobacteraceae bacterium]|jgi:hypothetical protein|nr:hypothetical protein [Solirubrobacteraceae bacterium]
MTKRESSLDGVHGVAFPAAVSPAAATLDIAVLGGMLVERSEDSDHLELKLFGRLDDESERLLEDVLPAGTDLLDLSGLDCTEPAALRTLTGRRREEHQAGRELLLRIAPHQASQLTQPEV